MSNKVGSIGRIFQHLKKTVSIVKQKEKFVGQDEFGNRYFEKIGDVDKGLKSQRRVEPRNPDQFTVPEVPVEWMTWLQGRRPNAPSVEEIEKNFITMVKTQHRAIELEESRLGEDMESDAAKQQEVPSGAGGSKFPVYSQYEDTPGEQHDRANKHNKHESDR